MAEKNKSITVSFKTWSTITNSPVSGDAANLSGEVSQDGGRFVALTGVISELLRANGVGSGRYKIYLSAATMNYDDVRCSFWSDTANVQCEDIHIITQTVPSISTIVSSGNAANWSADSTTVTITGLTPVALSQIVNSGNADGWSAYSTNVTVTGIIPYALSRIISSGNAEGWNAGISASGMNSLISGVISGIWFHEIDSASAEDMFKYMLAYTTGSVERSGSTYIYKSYDDSATRLTIVATNDGRTVTKS